MNTYLITEKQGINSMRDGYTIERKTLTVAKTYATKNKAFQGTIIEIEQDGLTVAVQGSNGVWIENNYFE